MLAELLYGYPNRMILKEMRQTNRQTETDTEGDRQTDRQTD